MTEPRRRPALAAARAGAGQPAQLLTAIADALNAAAAAGMDVRLKHNAVYTAEGYVLQLVDDRWAARTRNYTPFSPPPDAGDDDTD